MVRTPVASFTKEVNQRLAKRPLVFNGRLANRGWTSWAKEATGDVFLKYMSQSSCSLQWRHNEYDGVSNYRCLDCFFSRLFRRRSNKTSKLRVAGLCEVNPAVTGGFPSQRTSNGENVFIWWRHHVPTHNITQKIVNLIPGMYCMHYGSRWRGINVAFMDIRTEFREKLSRYSAKCVFWCWWILFRTAIPGNTLLFNGAITVHYQEWTISTMAEAACAKIPTCECACKFYYVSISFRFDMRYISSCCLNDNRYEY